MTAKTPRDDCMLYAGHINDRNYGVIKYGGKRYKAHRLTYLSAGKDIPEGYDVDHLCEVTYCINPDHLEAVTREENLWRAFKGKCKRGHELTKDNVYYFIANKNTMRVKRQCKTCHLERSRLRKLRVKQESLNG